LNIFQKFIIGESTIVISIFLYTNQYLHAALHLGLTIYLVNKLKGVKTEFSKEQ